MNEAVFTTIAITGFTVAFFHAAIPTHWLPFVLTARAQQWNHAKALGITALAGSGHVLFTAFLGLLLTLFGFALHEKIGHSFPLIAGGALLLFGLFYLRIPRFMQRTLHRMKIRKMGHYQEPGT